MCAVLKLDNLAVRNEVLNGPWICFGMRLILGTPNQEHGLFYHAPVNLGSILEHLIRGR